MLCCATGDAQEYRGDIKGRVIDAQTQEPIPQVHVVVVQQPAAGASTDPDGFFAIRGLGVGTYSLQVTAVGYARQVITNIVLSTGRSVPVLVKLDPKLIELEGVTTEASYFSRGQQISPLSVNVLDRSEVLRSPGGVQDVQRVAQNLPGVASSTDNINELIVRGGAPFENLTIMDHMEIPSINHYANQFNSAGPINMVNADMIEDVQFSTGGFPAQFGDKTSSVMNLTVREGNRGRSLTSKTFMHMAGAGTLIEGGMAEGRGSFILSVRNSLLEIVDRLMGLSTISLTAVPKYWDLQSKCVYDFTPSQRISVNLLYGDSRIKIEGDPKEEDEKRRNLTDSSTIEYMYPRTRQYAAGITLRSLWGKNGYSNLTLYSSGTTTDIDIRQDFLQRSRGQAGEVLSHRVLSMRRLFRNQGGESFLGGNYELVYQVSPSHTLSAGLQLLTALRWNNDVFIASDTSRFDINRDGVFETGPVITPEGYFSQHLGFGYASKYFVFVSDRFAVTPRLTLTGGVRYDHFTYPSQGQLSPRISLSYDLVPPTTAITVAGGAYYQVQPFPYYFDRRSIGYNRNLENMKADHYVIGLQHIMGPGLKLSLEAYYKNYSRIGVSEDFIHAAVDTFWSDRYLAVGKRYAYGIELFVEQKQVEDLFGTLSLSLSKTREKDPRFPPRADWLVSDYDYPLILTVLGGKVVKGGRDWLDGTPFFVKYPSYLLPISNEMEISFKFRYQTGRPYTPQVYVPWRQEREGGLKWTRGAWVTTLDHNAERYPDYSRLDLQWISRFYFSDWNINAYVALMNVLNRKNVFYEELLSDGTVETVYQFAFFPVVGVEVEF
jgi:hypothetical protein